MTDKFQRSSRGWRYAMDYIPDKSLFAAVMFALRMMREGTPPAIANTRAANYYDVEVRDVAHHTGKVGSRCARRKWRSG
jgi:hypothetical protein